MAGAKEIRTKIKSIKNTQKITKAMEMVAASQDAQGAGSHGASRPYAEKIRSVIGHLAQANPDYNHPYLMEREVKRVGYIIVSTDRGLCGGLNTNMFKRVLASMREWRDKDAELEMCRSAPRACAFSSAFGGKVAATATHLGDTPHINELIGTVKVMLDAYSEGRIDRLFLVHNEFVNTMTQKPVVRTLLPVETTDLGELQSHWDYIYEPDAIDLLDGMLMRYVESQVFRGSLENVACEMAARMVAMKSATDNAGEIIDNLQLVYNKARQAAITQEISEIVGGAAAV